MGPSALVWDEHLKSLPTIAKSTGIATFLALYNKQLNLEVGLNSKAITDLRQDGRRRLQPPSEFRNWKCLDFEWDNKALCLG
jgi:hypothetical protein